MGAESVPEPKIKQSFGSLAEEREERSEKPVGSGTLEEHRPQNQLTRTHGDHGDSKGLTTVLCILYG